MSRGLGLTALLAVLAAGCSGAAQGADVEDARQQIARQIDGIDACATLIAATGPLEFSGDAMAAPSVEALVKAGLIRRDPVAGDPGDRPRVRIVAGPNGSDVRMSAAADHSDAPALCFGKYRVTSVRQESDGSGGQRMRYHYRIVDAPNWTRDPEIRRAFPFLVRLLDGEHEAKAAAFDEQGVWTIPGDPRDRAMAEIGNKGFFPCPVPDNSAESPCT